MSLSPQSPCWPSETRRALGPRYGQITLEREVLQEDQFSSSIVTEAKPSFRFSRRQSVALVIGCTLVGAAAQILIKWGANGLVTSSPWAMLSNPPLVAGYGLYAVSTVLLVLALRDGELSVMYHLNDLCVGPAAIRPGFPREPQPIQDPGCFRDRVRGFVSGEKGQRVKTPFSSMLLVLLASIIGSVGAIFLKAGAARLHRQLSTLLLNWRLMVGVGIFLVSSYFFVLAVRQGELTVLYPLVSLGYIWTLFWSRIFFREPFTRKKFFGLGLILLGTVILALGRN